MSTSLHSGTPTQGDQPLAPHWPPKMSQRKWVRPQRQTSSLYSGSSQGVNWPTQLFRQQPVLGLWCMPWHKETENESDAQTDSKNSDTENKSDNQDIETPKKETTSDNQDSETPNKETESETDSKDIDNQDSVNKDNETPPTSHQEGSDE